MYDFVAGKQLVKASYYVSKSTALEEFPMLKANKLCGAIVYYDGESRELPFVVVVLAMYIHRIWSV